MVKSTDDGFECIVCGKIFEHQVKAKNHEGVCGHKTLEEFV